MPLPSRLELSPFPYSLSVRWAVSLICVRILMSATSKPRSSCTHSIPNLFIAFITRSTFHLPARCLSRAVLIVRAPFLSSASVVGIVSPHIRLTSIRLVHCCVFSAAHALRIIESYGSHGHPSASFIMLNSSSDAFVEHAILIGHFALMTGF